jgi:tetratricopeptide (TPR) repeat protein
MVNQSLPAATAAAMTAFQRGDLARARQLAQEQLTIDANAPLLHHLLGLIDCRLGQFDSGIARLEQAVAADPNNVPFRIAYCRALIDGGRATDALAAANPPSATGPAEIELWKVRAEAAFYCGDRATESDAWRKISSTRPEDVMAWTNLGRSLLAQYRFADAEAAYRRALAISPALVIRHELGLTLERSNQLEALGQLLDQALADGVPEQQLADLWALRALRSGDIDRAVRIAATIDIRPDPFRLNALKAKIADAADRPAEAFAAALAMNWSVGNPAEWRGRGRAYRDELRTRAQAMAAFLPQQQELPALERRSPAFLVGFPRSGTTLADIFLQGNSDIRVLEEVPILERVAQGLGGIAQLATVTPEKLATARDDYLAGLDALVDPDFTGLVIDKMPLNMLSLPLIAILFPDARIIFAQRHPCDCVLSCFMQAFVPSNAMASFMDLEDSADLYDAAMNFYVQARDQLNLPVHTLVYEDLVLDPAATLRPLMDFLQLEWRQEQLDHQGTAARRSVIKTPSYDSVTQPLSQRPSGRWRRYEAQMAPVLPTLLPWAERLGYRD